MAINFPNPATLNQTFTVGSKTWIYTGYSWDLVLANTTPVLAVATAAYGQANAAYTQANTGVTTAQSAYGQANAAYTQANTGVTTAQSAYGQANSAYNTANTKFSSSGGTISGSVTITTDLNVTGNVYLNGNVTTLSSNNLSINDPLIYLAQDNPANLQDIGFVGHFTTGTYQHTGFVRDASDSTWKLFSNVATEPTQTIDFTTAVYDTLQIGSLVASNASFSISNGTSSPFVVASNVVVANLNSDLLDGQHGTYYSGLSSAANTQANLGTSIAQSAYGQANTGVTTAQSAYGQANAAYGQANAAYTQANTGITLAQTAFGQANAAYNKANTAGSYTLSISNISAGYNIVSTDLGKIINCTSSSFTVTFAAAATLGSGFWCEVWNSATGGNVTLDPNGTEGIPLTQTYVLGPGQGARIVCDGTKFIVDQNPISNYVGSVAIGSGATVNNGQSVAIGYSAAAYGGYSVAVGSGATASNDRAIAIGYNAAAGVPLATAIGTNSGINGSSSQAAGATALGGSYASGVDSFAAAVANNTSSYGATGNNSIAIGRLAKASAANSVAIGSGSTGVGAVVATNAGAMSFGASYASGVDSFSAIIGNNTSAYGATTAHSIAFGYLSISNGLSSVAIGTSSNSSGQEALAIIGGTASGARSMSIGYTTSATSDYSTAIGVNSSGSGSQAVTGVGAMALGGSYASGVDSFAAAIGNNTSSYGALASNAIAIGRLATASSANSVAIGSGSSGVGAVAANTGAMSFGASYAFGVDSFAAGITNNTNTYGALGTSSLALQGNAKASGQYSTAIGYGANASGNAGSIAIGYGAIASGAGGASIGYQNNAAGGGNGCFIFGNQSTSVGTNSFSVGTFCASSAANSFAAGYYASTAQNGKYAYSGGAFSAAGDAQHGKIVLRATTTTTTAVALTSDGAAAATTNQLIVASNQAMMFTGTLIAKQTASANMAAYFIKGAIVNNAGTVSISGISLETLVDTIALDVQPTFTADNTNKGLAVTSGYKAATSIRWVCTIDSSEVTYA